MSKILEIIRTVFQGIVEGRARRAQLNLNYRSRSWE
jgi:hypothetical protein